MPKWHLRYVKITQPNLSWNPKHFVFSSPNAMFWHELFPTNLFKMNQVKFRKHAKHRIEDPPNVVSKIFWGILQVKILCPQKRLGLGMFLQLGASCRIPCCGWSLSATIICTLHSTSWIIVICCLSKLMQMILSVVSNILARFLCVMVDPQNIDHPKEEEWDVPQHQMDFWYGHSRGYRSLGSCCIPKKKQKDGNYFGTPNSTNKRY